MPPTATSIPPTLPADADADAANCGAPELDLDHVNADLADATAPDVVAWAARTFGEGLVLTSSFGVQAAVMLHLVTRVAPDVPVIFIDTGFHFPETYRFADALTERLKLNLKVYSPELSPTWMVVRHGRLWEQGREALNRYDQMRKVEPMRRALEELQVTGWLAGLRRGQTAHRSGLRRVEAHDGRYKVHPILTWTKRDVHLYLKDNDLPYHPLHDRGYASIGDWHSTRPITAAGDDDDRAGRFAGLKQECGLHLPASAEESASRDSSGL